MRSRGGRSRPRAARAPVERTEVDRRRREPPSSATPHARGVPSDDGLRRRSRGVRPVHGPVLRAARTRPRRSRGGRGGPDARSTSAAARCAHRRARAPPGRRRRSRRSTRRHRSSRPPGQRHPGVDVRDGAAESLPWPDGTFDRALAQLVVHFMADPVGAIREMARVTRPGGVVAACVWDHAGGRGPLAAFWAAAREADPDVDDESRSGGRPRGAPGGSLRRGGPRRRSRGRS